MRCNAVRLVATAGLASLCLGCTPGTSDSEADCTSRIKYHGTIYKPVGSLSSADFDRGAALGKGDVVDCGADPPSVGTVGVWAVDGVPTDHALMTRKKNMGSVLYVSEDLERSQYPTKPR